MARKRGMQYIPYDYEAAYNKAMEDMHEWFIENMSSMSCSHAIRFTTLLNLRTTGNSD